MAYPSLGTHLGAAYVYTRPLPPPHPPTALPPSDCAPEPVDQGLVLGPLPPVARLRGLDHLPRRQQPRLVCLRPGGLHDHPLHARRQTALAHCAGHGGGLRNLHCQPQEGRRGPARRHHHLRRRVARVDCAGPPARGLRPRPLVPGLHAGQRGRLLHLVARGRAQRRRLVG
eukprot:scaffold9905_cov117-Isochrysis_galbana.AAC.12